MDTNFEKEQLIRIVPLEVENACSAKILGTNDDTLSIELLKTNKQPNGQCECFSATEAGIVYFKSEVTAGKDNTYNIKKPNIYNVLQRREYTRIDFNASILLKANYNEYPVMITDLSAGGMKIISPTELQMSQSYAFQLHLSKQLTIDSLFTPIRQEKNEKDSFTVSGKFQNLTNRERIALVQYCFSKQMENTNK